MLKKLKRFESLTLGRKIIRRDETQVCRIMKDLEMIDMEHNCSHSTKGPFNEWRSSKLKTSKGQIFFPPCITGPWNHSSQEPGENKKE